MFFGSDLLSTFSIIWPAVLIFGLNHLLSLISSLLDKEEKTKSLEELFGEPYSRILPMHLIIIIYGFSLTNFSSFVFLPWGQAVTAGQLPQILGIIIFSILKIYADVVGHNKKHNLKMATGLFKEVNDKLKSGEIKAINVKDIKQEKKRGRNSWISMRDYQKKRNKKYIL
jgi:hypothetical protein